MTDKTIDDVIARESIEIPENVKELLKSADSWYFNIFDFNDATKNEPLRYMGHYLFNRYDLFRKFSISPAIFNNFITEIEAGYKKNNNPYHNNLHAADVSQTMNVLLRETKFIEWFTDLEILAALLSALIHDYDHMGKTNRFLVATGSDMALLYNDRSVQENHHISATFFLFEDEKYNILKNLSSEEYRQLRILIIDLVLSTDNAFHFTMLKDAKTKISSSKKPSKFKVLAVTLHAADISNQFKKYPINLMWSSLLTEEFFAQGDLERELKMKISPFCDRCYTCVPNTQLNFMDFIVQPTYRVLGGIENLIHNVEEQNDEQFIKKPWFQCYQENKTKWQEEIYKNRPSGPIHRSTI